MKQLPDRYISSFQAERFHKAVRFHWMVCWEKKPDELVSWGHAPTQALAEAAARDEVKDLSSGLSHGGRVSAITPFLHHR
jgi:ribulose-5-phosphate 4-epimerase/fuculose-1-phosphate aldolase